MIEARALQAVRLALDRRRDIELESENEEIVDAVQRGVLVADSDLVGWVRDPAFATLIDPVGSARTGGELLREGAAWVTWSLAWAAVEAIRAMGVPVGDQPA